MLLFNTVDYLWVFWIAIAIIAVVIELNTTDLSSIWATVGGLVAMVISLFCKLWWVQLIVFMAITLLGILLIRPYVKRYVKRNEIKTNSDALVGKIGVVTMEISDGNVGAVKVEGKEWSALAKNSEDSIFKDSKVEILAIDGVKLIVKEKN